MQCGYSQLCKHDKIKEKLFKICFIPNLIGKKQLLRSTSIATMSSRQKN